MVYQAVLNNNMQELGVSRGRIMGDYVPYRTSKKNARPPALVMRTASATARVRASSSGIFSRMLLTTVTSQ